MKTSSRVRVAESESQIEACSSVMRELRPHVPSATFVARVRSQQEQGYRLAYIADADRVVAVAGFRLSENLAWGRFLFVDDLVTAADARSRGHGAALLRWLHDFAESQGCRALHLDSGVQRVDAHRFYKGEGMQASGYHFTTDLGTGRE